MHLSVSSWRGGRRQGIGQGFDRSLWPGGGAFEFHLACPGDRDILKILVSASDHKSFPGVGNFSYI